jgi:hypothetical protein
MEKLKPISLDDDPAEEDCSGVGYLVPNHEGEGGKTCPNGGVLIVRENELSFKADETGAKVWRCRCGQSFRAGIPLNSRADLASGD